MDTTKKPGRGGKRSGSGRHIVPDKRVPRCISFNAAEWELISNMADEQGLSIREYLFSLVEKDRLASH